MTTATHPGATKAPDTAAFNHWVKSALTDHSRASLLKHDWRKLAMAELPLSEAQHEHLVGIPVADATALQAAIAQVVDFGGTIHIERASETSAGTLVVKPASKVGSKSVTVEQSLEPNLSVGIFHCTFNAHCRNWHCGWGPSKSK
jgi:hypothetical protein